MNILQKIFCYGVHRYHYEKSIGIKDFFKQLALDCFKNNFVTDTETTSKNKTPIDEDDDGNTVCTFRAHNFYSYDYCSTQFSNISDINVNSASYSAYTSVDYTIVYHNNSEKEGAGE